MGKKILRVYLAKNDTPYSAAYAKLELPASPWEVWDAMEKVRLQTDDILYMEIEDYFAFEYLSPHLDGLDISLNELNDLAAQLAALDEVQEIAFEGMFSIEVQRKVNANGGVITLQDLRDLAVSAKTDCYHVVDAADDAQLGRFYAENDFIPELDGVSDLEDPNGFRLTDAESLALQTENQAFEQPMKYEIELTELLDFTIPFEHWELWKTGELAKRISDRADPGQVGRALKRVMARCGYDTTSPALAGGRAGHPETRLPIFHDGEYQQRYRDLCEVNDEIL